MDGESHYVDKWDLLIGHPPCTYLCISGNKHFEVAQYGNKARERMKERYKAIVFFTRMMEANAEKICIENPIGIMSGAYRKPDQIIHPYQFGDPYRKTTCLWLKGLSPLMPTNVVDPEIKTYKTKSGKTVSFDELGWKYKDPKIRSKTFPGIAKAMAEQWG